MEFTKMQGAGNDFVVIDAKNNRTNWNELAIKMCDRHYGIGADGLLLSLPSKTAHFKMRIFNADGSESAVCGNGLRCLVSHYLTNPNWGNLSEVTVETSVGLRTAKIRRQKNHPIEIQVNMGEPQIGLKQIPVNKFSGCEPLDIISLMNTTVAVNSQKLLLSLVSVGNPHAVHFIDYRVNDFPLVDLGAKVEQHRLFPDETNFEVVRVIDKNNIEARVWERGVGETLACGSGACAIMVAGHLLGKLDKKAEMKLPGGVLKVEWNYGKENNIYLSGPAETVFCGEW
jgi:diaminopimelate epimerase